MDNCLEKKIYDRQINKQGMADRVVDECNPDAHLSIKEVTNLCWDNEQDSEPRDFSAEKEKYIDVVMQKVLQKFGTRLSKVCFMSSLISPVPGALECGSLFMTIRNVVDAIYKHILAGVTNRHVFRNHFTMRVCLLTAKRRNYLKQKNA